MVANLTKLVVHGSGLGEEFAFGFYLGRSSAITSESDLTTLLDGWDSRNNTVTTPSTTTNLKNCLSTDQTIDTLSAYFYADSTAPATFLHHKTVSYAGGSSGNLPLQLCAVATLNTARSGASYRGRMYIPLTGASCDPGHKIPTLFRDQVGNVATNLMSNALAAARAGALGDPTRCVVYSRAKNSIEDVKSVSVDVKFDVQRRRAMKQPAARSTYVSPNP